MKKNKIVLFDIDYTLFNTAIFREKLYAAISKALNINVDELKSVQQEVMDAVVKENGYFNPEKFSIALAKKLNRESDYEIIKNALLKTDNFENNYYNETLNILKKLSADLTVGIFSKGFTDFQNEKIKGVQHLLDENHIYITLNKQIALPDLIEKYKDNILYLVDDALDVLYTAWKLNQSIITIWVKRGKYAMNQNPISGFKPTFEVETLTNVPSLIKGETK